MSRVGSGAKTELVFTLWGHEVPMYDDNDDNDGTPVWGDWEG